VPGVNIPPDIFPYVKNRRIVVGKVTSIYVRAALASDSCTAPFILSVAIVANVIDIPSP
jgi:hypothetical protein